MAERSRALGESRLKVLLLGVTPELAQITWPLGTELVAVDQCQEMIDGVWPGPALSVKANAILGDWRSLPLADSSVHFVVGDGIYTTLGNPADARAVSAEIRRVLTRGGFFIHRFFVRPRRTESFREIVEDLRAGLIGNFHVFKWRLAMACRANHDGSVSVEEIWKAWRALGIGEQELADDLGWPRESIETINAYKGVAATYAFPTLHDLRRRLSDDFIELGCCSLDYELGDRCPILLLSPRA